MSDKDNSADAFVRAMEERNKDSDRKVRTVPEDFASRTLGVIALATALLLCFMYTYAPIVDAQAGKATIDYSGKWVFMQPLLLGIGIVYSLFGEHTSRVLGPTTKPSIWGWVFYGTLAIACFVYVHQIEVYLRGLGYSV
jgi:hypothetical protein